MKVKELIALLQLYNSDSTAYLGYETVEEGKSKCIVETVDTVGYSQSIQDYSIIEDKNKVIIWGE